MKKLFSEPEMKIAKFEYEDMVRTSGFGEGGEADAGDGGGVDLG